MLYFYDNLETTGWQVLCLKEPTNEEDENAVAVVSTNSHFIYIGGGWEWVTEYLHYCIHVSISVPLYFGYLYKLKCINPGGEYGLEFCGGFHFYGLGKAIKLAKT